MRSTRPIAVHLYEEDIQHIGRLARREGVTVSAFIRARLPHRRRLRVYAPKGSRS